MAICCVTLVLRLSPPQHDAGEFPRLQLTTNPDSTMKSINCMAATTLITDHPTEALIKPGRASVRKLRTSRRHVDGRRDGP